MFAGKFTFKLMSRQDKSFGVIGTMTGEHKIITSLAWLTAEILVAGTSNDQLLFIEGGDAKQNFTASIVHLLDLEKAKETYDLYITLKLFNCYELSIVRIDFVVMVINLI